jgi:hypothetical protein
MPTLDFWRALDTLVSSSEILIDRPHNILHLLLSNEPENVNVQLPDN